MRNQIFYFFNLEVGRGLVHSDLDNVNGPEALVYIATIELLHDLE